MEVPPGSRARGSPWAVGWGGLGLRLALWVTLALCCTQDALFLGQPPVLRVLPVPPQVPWVWAPGAAPGLLVTGSLCTCARGPEQLGARAEVEPACRGPGVPTCTLALASPPPGPSRGGCWAQGRSPPPVGDTAAATCSRESPLPALWSGLPRWPRSRCTASPSQELSPSTTRQRARLGWGLLGVTGDGASWPHLPPVTVAPGGAGVAPHGSVLGRDRGGRGAPRPANRPRGLGVVQVEGLGQPRLGGGREGGSGRDGQRRGRAGY